MDFEFEYQKLLELVTSSAPEGFDPDQISKRHDLLPDSLRFVCETAGKMELNQIHNRLLAPSQLQLDDDGYVTFAEENQNVVAWGFKASETTADPMIFQRQLAGEAFGSWIAEGRAMSSFLITCGYWNAAAGGADVSGVGEIGPTTRARVEALPLIWRSTDFDVRGGADGLAIVTADGDFYAFGRESEGIEQLVESLEADWFDLE